MRFVREWVNYRRIDGRNREKPNSEDESILYALLEVHARYTGSARAKAILADFENALPNFVKVFPMEYRRVLGQMTTADAAIQRAETHS